MLNAAERVTRIEVRVPHPAVAERMEKKMLVEIVVECARHWRSFRNLLTCFRSSYVRTMSLFPDKNRGRPYLQNTLTSAAISESVTSSEDREWGGACAGAVAGAGAGEGVGTYRVQIFFNENT